MFRRRTLSYLLREQFFRSKAALKVRVLVVQGEVKVDHAGKQETLLPGDQTTTSPSLDRTPVQQNVAWSRNASRYAESRFGPRESTA